MRLAQRGSIGWSLSVERATESNPVLACSALGLFHYGVQLGFRYSIRYGNEQSRAPGGSKSRDTLANRFHDVVVLGAGPAGIAAGLALGDRATVLEQSSHPGGLSGSIEMEGAQFDIGGHSFHTPHPEIRELVASAVELYQQPRDARCFSHGSLIRYPFQKHFRELTDQRVVDECAAGLAAAEARPRAAHFREFLEHRFGAGISRHFMTPYNQKLWGADLTRLAADWVGERVAAPEGVKESFDEGSGKRKPLQDDTWVAYPAQGGFGTIMSALAARLPKLLCRRRVVAIDPRSRVVKTDTGEEHRASHIISTLPLPLLLELCHGVPKELTAAVAQLHALSLRVVLLVVDHPVDTPIQRIYCADDTVPSHKVALNHNSSDYLRALPRHGIMAEVSCANGLSQSSEQLTRWTVAGLRQMNVIRDASEICASRVIDIKYGYPVPTHERDSIVAHAKAWLEERQIHTVGRFGEWAYINADEAMHRGLRLGRALHG